jgi:hypothetical protein
VVLFRGSYSSVRLRGVAVGWRIPWLRLASVWWIAISRRISGHVLMFSRRCNSSMWLRWVPISGRISGCLVGWCSSSMWLRRVSVSRRVAGLERGWSGRVGWRPVACAVTGWKARIRPRVHKAALSMSRRAGASVAVPWLPLHLHPQLACRPALVRQRVPVVRLALVQHTLQRHCHRPNQVVSRH